VNSAPGGCIRDRVPDLYVTATALRSRKRRPNPRAEAAAFRALYKSLAVDPVAAMRQALDTARKLCGAGSAGLSLFPQDPVDHPMVHWELVSGTLSHHEGANAPGASSSCGLCLDTGVAIVISRPGRVFTHLAALPPSILEELVVPLYDSAEKPLGTLWAAHHDKHDRFHRDDVRILEQLGAAMILALHLQKQTIERRHLGAVLESRLSAQRDLLAHDLYQERREREQAECAHHQALLFKDAMVDEMNHRTKNTLQIASNLLSLQAHAASSPPVREALLDGSARLNSLAKVHQLLYAAPDGTQSILMPELLRLLGSSLQELFGSARAHVALEITADPITLRAQDAVAIALLANEAVTNAYKHAFPAASPGTITVELRCTANGAMTLRITDTGTGLLVSSGGEGLGLTLIRTLATQLKGTLEIAATAGSPGTRIALTIDAPPAG
jgi:two-component sensor histidine kinase